MTTAEFTSNTITYNGAATTRPYAVKITNANTVTFSKNKISGLPAGTKGLGHAFQTWCLGAWTLNA